MPFSEPRRLSTNIINLASAPEHVPAIAACHHAQWAYVTYPLVPATSKELA